MSCSGLLLARMKSGAHFSAGVPTTCARSVSMLGPRAPTATPQPPRPALAAASPAALLLAALPLAALPLAATLLPPQRPRPAPPPSASFVAAAGRGACRGRRPLVRRHVDALVAHWQLLERGIVADHGEPAVDHLLAVLLARILVL